MTNRLKRSGLPTSLLRMSYYLTLRHHHKSEVKLGVANVSFEPGRTEKLGCRAIRTSISHLPENVYVQTFSMNVPKNQGDNK